MPQLSLFRLIAILVLLSVRNLSAAPPQSTPELGSKLESKRVKGMDVAVLNTEAWSYPAFQVLLAGTAPVKYSDVEVTAFSRDGKELKVRTTMPKDLGYRQCTFKGVFRETDDVRLGYYMAYAGLHPEERLAKVKIKIGDESATFNVSFPQSK